MDQNKTCPEKLVINSTKRGIYHACFTGNGAWGNGVNSIIMHDNTKCEFAELTTETTPMMSTPGPFVSRAWVPEKVKGWITQKMEERTQECVN